MYQNPDSKEAQSTQKALSMTSSVLASNKGEYAVNNFLESTSFSSTKTPIFKKSMYSGSDASPKKKVKPFSPPFQRYYYRDFIWKIAFNHNILLECPENYDKKLKVFIGRGNNSMLVKSLFKRRKWWSFTQKIDDANFIWTQIKNNYIFAIQPNKQSTYIEISEEIQINRKNEAYKQHSALINDEDYALWSTYFSKNRRFEDTLDESMKKRNKHLGKLKTL